MFELMDKGFLLVCCLIMGLAHSAEPFMAIPFLLAVAASAANTYKSLAWLRGGSICLLSVLGVWEPAFLLFIPLCLYDVFVTPQVWFTLLLVPLLILKSQTLGLSMTAFVLLFSGSAFLLKQKNIRYVQLADSHHQLRDSAAELAMKLNSTNRELRIHQDEQVHSAMLMERNRIAREIHDNVGHLLSSAMLQLGALLTVTQAEDVKAPLRTLKGTLSEAMGSIRQSVHGLHDESVDLQLELSAVVRSFSFCQASLDYDVESNPDRRIKYAFLNVVKEALSNVIKHSNATQVSVTVREHPALYQLDIRDNGKNAAYDKETAGGIGIANMTSRIADLNGRLLITTENGFHIFISVPKEGPK